MTRKQNQTSSFTHINTTIHYNPTYMCVEIIGLFLFVISSFVYRDSNKYNTTDHTQTITFLLVSR